MRNRIVGNAHVDEHVVAVELHRKAPQLVGKLIERAAGREVEACVMPVTGEDPVAHGAAMEWKAHVWTAVVDRVDLVGVSEQAERVAVDVDDQPPLRAQLGKRRRADEARRGNSSHALLLLHQKRGSSGSRASSSSRVTPR